MAVNANWSLYKKKFLLFILLLFFIFRNLNWKTSMLNLSKPSSQILMGYATKMFTNELPNNRYRASVCQNVKFWCHHSTNNSNLGKIEIIKNLNWHFEHFVNSIPVVREWNHDCILWVVFTMVYCLVWWWCYKKMIYTKHIIRLDTDQHDSSINTGSLETIYSLHSIYYLWNQ